MCGRVAKTFHYQILISPTFKSLIYQAQVLFYNFAQLIQSVVPINILISQFFRGLFLNDWFFTSYICTIAILKLPIKSFLVIGN